MIVASLRFRSVTFRLLSVAAFLLCAMTHHAAQAQGPAVIFTSTSIGSSTTGTVTFAVTSAPATVVGRTQGIPGLDFTVLSGSCSSSSCTYTVKFAPTAPGVRSGAAVAINSAGATLGYGLVTGIGLASQAVLYPAPKTLLIPNLHTPYGIWVDPAGNIYSGDDGLNIFYKYTKSGNTYTTSTIGSGGAQAADVVLDGAGNVYGCDYDGNGSTGNGIIYKFPYSNGTYGARQTSFAFPANQYCLSIAIDINGNLYMATGTSTVLKATLQSNGTFVLSNLFSSGSPYTYTLGVAVDAASNLYIVQSDFTYTGNNNLVSVEKYSGGTYTYQRIGTLINPGGVAVDAGGNVYVAEYGMPSGTSSPDPGAAVFMYNPVGGSYVQTTIGSGFNAPISVITDGAGRVYVSDDRGDSFNSGATSDNIYVIDPTGTPTFAFGNVVVGQSSATQTATLVNAGYSALTFTTPASGGNPSIASGFAISNSSTCPQLTSGSSTQTLAAGNSCTDIVKFSPITGGSQSGQLVTSDNSYGTASTQTVNLTGNATTGSTVQTISFTQPTTPVIYPATGSEALSASSTSGLAITFAVTSGPGAISGSAVVFSGTGTVVVQASQAGNATYAAATPVSRSIVVNSADVTSTALTLGSATATVGGSTVSLSAVVSDTTNTGTTPTGSVTFTDTLSGNTTTLVTINLTGNTAATTYTPLTAGSHTITAAYNPSSGSFTTSGSSKTLTISTGAVTPTGSDSTYTVAAGSPLVIVAFFNYTGPHPTGAVTFTVNGSASNITTPSCVYKSTHATCQATYTPPANTTAGNYTFNYAEAADANYAISSGSSTITVTSASGHFGRDPGNFARPAASQIAPAAAALPVLIRVPEATPTVTACPAGSKSDSKSSEKSAASPACAQ